MRSQKIRNLTGNWNNFTSLVISKDESNSIEIINRNYLEIKTISYEIKQAFGYS